MDISTKPIQLQDVASSQIHSIGHDPETNTLAVRFFRGFGRDQVPGSLYHYANVSAEDFTAFKTADSIGRHFGQHIKPYAEKFPFVKVAAGAAEVQA